MRSGVIVILAIVVALFLFSRGTDGSTTTGGGTGSNSSTVGHLSVVPTIRSVTVSPGSVEFGSCSGGDGATNSTPNAMGYPRRSSRSCLDRAASAAPPRHRPGPG